MPSSAPLEIAVLLMPRFSLMALSAVLEPFRIANRLAERPLYRWRFVSPMGGAIEASSGLPITAERTVRAPVRAGRVIVCTSFEPLAAANREVLAWLRALDRSGAELWAVDTGAFLLAEAGLLHGQRVTLHWESIAAFAELYPKVETRRSLFERSGRVATCAGGTAGIDLSLSAIAREHGTTLAFDVADQLIHQQIRDPAAPQQIAPMRRYGTRNPTVLRAIELLHGSIEQPPSLTAAAAALGVSPRQLQRLFTTHLGRSFKRFDRELRLERARELLEQTSLSVLEIAMATGFGSVEHFSRSYKALFGTSPGRARLVPG
ncbi:GlxA family transcriptional regulator [Benzoatithermus flavus]|uniref:GlxA family transcriptional regulator n=1 Tax=Benzoatithermus flavus TaxID=3108223 RepID=A0ABU8XTA7_9PROT